MEKNNKRFFEKKIFKNSEFNFKDIKGGVFIIVLFILTAAFFVAFYLIGYKINEESKEITVAIDELTENLLIKTGNEFESIEVEIPRVKLIDEEKHTFALEKVGRNFFNNKIEVLIEKSKLISSMQETINLSGYNLRTVNMEQLQPNIETTIKYVPISGNIVHTIYLEDVKSNAWSNTEKNAVGIEIFNKNGERIAGSRFKYKTHESDYSPKLIDTILSDINNSEIIDITSSQEGIAMKIYTPVYDYQNMKTGVVLVTYVLDKNYAKRLKHITDSDIVLFHENEKYFSTLQDKRFEIVLNKDELNELIKEFKIGRIYISQISDDGETKNKILYTPIFNKNNELVGMIGYYFFIPFSAGKIENTNYKNPIFINEIRAEKENLIEEIEKMKSRFQKKMLVIMIVIIIISLLMLSGIIYYLVDGFFELIVKMFILLKELLKVIFNKIENIIKAKKMKKNKDELANSDVIDVIEEQYWNDEPDESEEQYWNDEPDEQDDQSDQNEPDEQDEKHWNDEEDEQYAQYWKNEHNEITESEYLGEEQENFEYEELEENYEEEFSNFDVAIEEFDKLAESNKTYYQLITDMFAEFHEKIDKQAGLSNELKNHLEGVSLNAKKISEIVQETEDKFKTQQETVIDNGSNKNLKNSAAEAMEKIRLDINELKELETFFLEKLNLIDDFVRSINSIAEHTNLLSLNAAIEAARAGDVGKGFSVVANEIKKIAEKSEKAAAEIHELVINLRKISDKMETQIDKGIKSVNMGIKITQDTQVASLDLNDKISKYDEKVYLITKSADEQLDIILEASENNRKILDISNRIAKMIDNHSNESKQKELATQELIEKINSILNIEKEVDKEISEEFGLEEN